METFSCLRLEYIGIFLSFYLNFQNSSIQVGEQFAQKTEDSTGYEFTGELFQPVPWSVTTPHGMPQVDLIAVFQHYTSSYVSDKLCYEEIYVFLLMP